MNALRREKIGLRHLLLVLLLCSNSAYAFGGPELLYLVGATGYTQSHVWIGRFTAPNGVTFDTSEYYKEQKPTFHIRTATRFQISGSSSIYIPMFFDNGYLSDLLVTTPLLTLGAGLQIIYSQNIISFQVDNLLQVGGRQEETPCVDIFLREFHCGLGVPWVDAPALSKSSGIQPSVKISITRYF